jgi:hypothetical protein
MCAQHRRCHEVSNKPRFTSQVTVIKLDFLIMTLRNPTEFYDWQISIFPIR